MRYELQAAQSVCLLHYYVGMVLLLMLAAALQRGWLTALLSKSAWFRDRLLYDSRFLFIVLAEIAIDTGASLAYRCPLPCRALVHLQRVLILCSTRWYVVQLAPRLRRCASAGTNSGRNSNFICQT